MNIKYQLIVRVVLFISIWCSNLMGQGIPSSPCPKLFQYRYDGTKWFGRLTLNNPPANQQLHLKIIMSLRGKPLTSFLGEIELITRGQFSENSPILYQIQFPINSNPPKLNQILVNNQIRCFGEPDHGIFVTVIQLEHTRKYKFISDDKEENEKRIDDFYQLNDEIYSKPAVDEMINFRTNSADNCGKSEIRSVTESDLRFPNNQRDQNDIIRGSWPWLAAIYVNNMTSLSYQCGGTIISSRLVLSSAHCFQMQQRKFRANEILVFLGRYNLKNWNEDGSVAASCDEIFIHPDYDINLRSFDADIAVLVLRNVIRYSEFIRPICLWTGSTDTEYIEGERGIVVGWGRNNDKISVTIPRKIIQIITPDWRCRQSSRKLQTLTSNRTFCAVGDYQHRYQQQDHQQQDERHQHSEKSGPCSGDSGSGLMIRRNNRWTLRGIVSASIPKYYDGSTASAIINRKQPSIMVCVTNEYVIYTDVGKFLDWIYAFMI